MGKPGRTSEAGWSRLDLARPAVALSVVLALALSLPTAFVVGCNAHEVGHALTGTAFGWEVDRIVPCAPAGGEVRYRTSSSRGDLFESWSGGLTGAFALIGAYVVAIRIGSRPLRSPIAWAAGLGLLVPVGPQLVIAILEGTNRARSYGETISANAGVWIPIILISAMVGPAWHLWRWREVLQRRSTHPKGATEQSERGATGRAVS